MELNICYLTIELRQSSLAPDLDLVLYGLSLTQLKPRLNIAIDGPHTSPSKGQSHYSFSSATVPISICSHTQRSADLHPILRSSRSHLVYHRFKNGVPSTTDPSSIL